MTGRLLALNAVLLCACQGATPPTPSRAAAQPPPTRVPAPPVYEHEYQVDAPGSADFVNRTELPNTTFHIHGVHRVQLFEGYAVVEEANGMVTVIPRERLISIGASFE